MAPKRNAKSKPKPDRQPASKKRKLVIGAKTVDDDLLTPQTQSSAPSSSAWSTRVLPLDRIPSLSTLCLRVFSDNLQKLAQNHDTFGTTRAWLKALPDSTIPRLFATLRTSCPDILSNAFIVAVCILSYYECVIDPDCITSIYYVGLRLSSRESFQA